jgi:hypothetical protein
VSSRQAVRLLALIFLLLPALILLSQAHPSKPPAQEKALFLGSNIDPGTLALFQRSCQNCHSENTQWPWYSHIQPLSYLINKDVQEARHHVDFSNWNAYSPDQKRDLLSRMGSLVRSGQMPLPRYVALHGDAKLTPKQRQQIYQWSRAERKRLLQGESFPSDTK